MLALQCSVPCFAAFLIPTFDSILMSMLYVGDVTIRRHVAASLE
jgi:hypothetical protein